MARFPRWFLEPFLSRPLGDGSNSEDNARMTRALLAIAVALLVCGCGEAYFQGEDSIVLDMIRDTLD